MSYTYVFRWNGFEMVREQDEKLRHPDLAEIMLGQEISELVHGKLQKFIQLWQFKHVGEDEEGRLLYDAVADPYESVVKEREALFTATAGRGL